MSYTKVVDFFSENKQVRKLQLKKCRWNDRLYKDFIPTIKINNIYEEFEIYITNYSKVQ